MYEVHVHTSEGLRAAKPLRTEGGWEYDFAAHPTCFQDIGDAWLAANGIALHCQVRTAVFDALVRFPVASFNEQGDLATPPPLPPAKQDVLRTGA